MVCPRIRFENSESGKVISKLAAGGVVVLLRASEQMVWSSKLYRNIADARHEGHPEFKVLHCFSKKSGSKLNVWW